jgi:hypothetical protein
MLTQRPYLTVEITRAADALLRVVFSRSDRPAQQVKEHPFDPEATARVAAELTAAIAAAPEQSADWEGGPGRLAARFAGMILPTDILDNLASGLPVEFVLDDYCMSFPVEALPGGGALGMETAVVRRWLCDTLPREQKKRHGGVEMLIVADPAGSHPAARREGQAVLRFMREANPDWRIRYLSRSVSRASLDDELPDTDIFHIAAHMDETPPGVRMADGAWLPTDGVAPGVVVAACCHAGGLGGAGRELAGRFLRAGTRQVIAPSTAVSDRLGEFFSRELYRRIAAGDTLANAVLATRKTLGTSGLIFIHYGTMTEQLPPAAAPKVAGKKPLRVGVALLALAALLTLAFWLGRAATEPKEAIPEPARIADAPAVASAAVVPDDAPAVVAVPDAPPAAPQETAETKGKTAVPRVSEKMLENF